MPRPVKCRKVCHFPNVLEFLPADDTEKKAPIVLTVDEYETKENSIPEVHRRYADIQIVLSGTEQIGYGGICDNFEGYDEARDILFLKADCDFVKADKTRFFMFYPGEIHQPCMTRNEKSKIKKAVFKILCE